MNMPKSRDIQVKIPSPKAIFNGFWLVTVKVLNSYVYFTIIKQIKSSASLLTWFNKVKRYSQSKQGDFLDLVKLEVLIFISFHILYIETKYIFPQKLLSLFVKTIIILKICPSKFNIVHFLCYATICSVHFETRKITRFLLCHYTIIEPKIQR